jgi:Holliday junction resolvasome RuvABC ATP-dependent DNA helicase subunit
LNNVNKIFGPPGAGKTTYLLNVVDAELENHVPSIKIGAITKTNVDC